MKKVFFAIVMLIVFLASCSTDRIKSITAGERVTMYNYGRVSGTTKLISVTTSDNSFKLIFDYTVSPITATETITGITSPIIFTLDSHDRATCDNRGNCQSNTPYTYEYDAAGYILKSIFSNYVDNRHYTSDGNCDHEWFTNGRSGDWSYTYTSDLSAFENNMQFLGIRNNNWPLQQKDNLTQQTKNFTYHHDSNHHNRVDQQIANRDTLFIEYYP